MASSFEASISHGPGCEIKRGEQEEEEGDVLKIFLLRVASVCCVYSPQGKALR